MITPGTKCCGKCGRWFYGYYCPYCNKERRQGRPCIDSENQAFKKGVEYGYSKGKAELIEVTARLEKQKEINKELVDLQEETIKTFNSTIEEVKSLINDLLDNSDEYARQRARDYLERG